MNKKLSTYTGLFILSIVFSFVVAIFTPEDTFSPLHINYDSHSHCSGREFKMEVVTTADSTSKLLPEQQSKSYESYETSVGVGENTIAGAGENVEAPHEKTTFSLDVNLRHCNHTSDDNSYIKIHNDNEQGELIIRKATLLFEMDSIPTWTIIVAVITVIAALACYVWIAILVIRTLRNIKKNNIFVSQMTKDIETLGKILVVIFFIGLIFHGVFYLYASGHYGFTDYQIVFGVVDKTQLLLGTGLMLLSQIIGMGKELKEDSDLTI